MAGERKSWRVPFAGLAGFAVGAATVLLIVWLYGGGLTGGAPPPETSPEATVQAPPVTQAPTPQTPPPAAPQAQVPPPPPMLARPPEDLVQRNLLVPVQGVPRTALQDTEVGEPRMVVASRRPVTPVHRQDGEGTGRFDQIGMVVQKCFELIASQCGIPLPPVAEGQVVARIQAAGL